MLSPYLAESVGARYKFGFAFARHAVRRIKAKIETRRTKSAHLMLPDGRHYFIAAEIPPAEIRLEEVNYSAANQARLARFTAPLISITGPPPSTPATPSNRQPDTPARGQPRARDSAALNFGTHRVLFLSTHDFYNISVLLNADFMSRFLQAPGGDIQGAMDNVVSQLSSNRFRRGKDIHPSAGLEHIKWLQSHDLLGGLYHFWNAARETTNIGYPNNPSLYLGWFLLTNPIITRVIELVNLHMLSNQQRLAFFTDTPWD